MATSSTTQEAPVPVGFRAAVDGQLAPGETVRWAGQPDPRRIALHSFWIGGNIWLALVAYLAIGGAIVTVTIVGAAVGKDAWFWIMLGTIAMCVGGALVANHLRHAVYLGRRTLYVLTERRVLIVDDRGAWSIERDKLVSVEGWERPGGRGSLLLHHYPYMDGDGNGSAKRTFLIGLADVHHVGRLALDLQRGTRYERD